jgi:hypothetical protein
VTDQTIGPALAAAIAELQTQLPHIEKARTAKVKGRSKAGVDFDYTYKYEGLTEVSDAILPLLGKLGMAWVTRPTINERGEFVLAYTLAHTSGESVGGEWPLAKGASQDMGSAVTYARRYTLCAVTGLAPAADDDDAQAAEAAAAKRATRTTRAKAEPAAEGPTKITGDQMAKMQALFTQQNVTDREAKLAYCAEVIGHAIGSATDLTKVEGSKVIDKLTRWVAQDEPPAGGAS